MARDKSLDPWPPGDGQRFIRSDRFGRLLVELVKQLSTRYPLMDFTDAVAQVFAWFDARLVREPDFISPPRFRTPSAFRAYLRQAVWNAARLAQRQRQRFQHITALPVDQPIVERELSPEERASLLERVESLPYLHRVVLEKLFFDEDDVPMIASVLDLSEERVCELYEEAIDLLGIA